MEMKKILINGLVFLALQGFLSCTSQGTRPKMQFYHGLTVANLYVSVVRHTSEVIVFEIRARVPGKDLYHLVLDGNEPLSEGWFPTGRVQTESYTVQMKAKKGCVFQPGKKYRLCIGTESPESVYVHSNNYKCTVDYEFVLD
jgi:hypothetical protein